MYQAVRHDAAKPVGVHVAIYCAADSRYSMKPSDFH